MKQQNGRWQQDRLEEDAKGRFNFSESKQITQFNCQTHLLAGTSHV
jgi:hypothetical protein